MEFRLVNGTTLDAGGHAITASALVTHQRGSWRWQSAYHHSQYGLRIRRKRGNGDSLYVWTMLGTGSKLSLPQARKAGLGDLQQAGKHQQPVDPVDLQGLALVEELVGIPTYLVEGVRS